MTEAATWLRIVRAGPDALPAVLAFSELCTDAPRWPRSAWQEYLPPQEPSQSKHALFLLQDAGRDVHGWIAGTALLQIAELEFLLIAPSLRGQGWGRQLLERWMRWAILERCHTAHLEVRASNAAALHLYTHVGFRLQARRPQYYRGPVEDALLLSASLNTEGDGSLERTTPEGRL